MIHIELKAEIKLLKFSIKILKKEVTLIQKALSLDKFKILSLKVKVVELKGKLKDLKLKQKGFLLYIFFFNSDIIKEIIEMSGKQKNSKLPDWIDDNLKSLFYKLRLKNKVKEIKKKLLRKIY